MSIYNKGGQSGITEAIEEAMNNLGYQHQVQPMTSIPTFILQCTVH